MLLGQTYKPPNTVYQRGEGVAKPAWLAFDKQVLSFDAYCKEPVDNRREEKELIRQVKIYFYLEDDSIQIIEPRHYNASYSQGTILKRHRIPLPPPNNEFYYTLEYFNVGKEMLFYGRAYKIVDCDAFTREFLEKYGVRVPNPEPMPESPYIDYRRKVFEKPMNPLRPYFFKKTSNLKQFLEYDRQVLRFYAYWDDSEKGGLVHRMVLRYFLSDDTIQLVAKLDENSGYDTPTVFLHRSKLPKRIIPTKLAGAGENPDQPTILNFFGDMYNQYHIFDNLKNLPDTTEYYNQEDLKIGATVCVWGRKFVIYDCDEFTRFYYFNKYGLTEDEMKPIDVPSYNKILTIEKVVPPYNGFGSEEDSLGYCKTVQPKPPPRDMIKLISKDGDVLRFTAGLVTDDPIAKNRLFILSFFPKDDTFIIFEPPFSTQGFPGGKYVDHTRIKKPGQPKFSSKLSEYYTEKDLYVSAVIDVNGQKYILKTADECTLKYMEDDPEEFVYANKAVILEKIRSAIGEKEDELKRFMYSGDPELTGIITFDHFRQFLCNLIGDDLNKHEVLTLGRSYQHKEKPPLLSQNTLLAMLQEDLRKRNFDTFKELECQFFHHDRDTTGFLDAFKIERTCKAFRLPINFDVLKLLLARFEKNEKEEINYKELVNLLNWKINPAVADDAIPEKPFIIKSDDIPQEVKYIQYKPFLENIFGTSDI